LLLPPDVKTSGSKKTNPLKGLQNESSLEQTCPFGSRTLECLAELATRLRHMDRELTLNASEYERLVAVMDRLIDQVGEDESHLLASLMEVIGVLIEKYEDEQVPEL
jgi:hypothetical protein